MAALAPFLTQSDSRAAVRGSRDPLGLVPIWSAYGRRVVGNLTTASTSLRGFTTLLLGYYCADRILEKETDQTPLSVFLRVEQLVSYCRNNRLNVAMSRAKALAVLVCSPRLLETRCRTVEQMRLVNGLCRLEEHENLLKRAQRGHFTSDTRNFLFRAFEALAQGLRHDDANGV